MVVRQRVIMPITYPFSYSVNVNSFEFFSGTNNGAINILVANISCIFIITSLEQVTEVEWTDQVVWVFKKYWCTYKTIFLCAVKIICGCELAALYYLCNNIYLHIWAYIHIHTIYVYIGEYTRYMGVYIYTHYIYIHTYISVFYYLYTHLYNNTNLYKIASNVVSIFQFN